ncbi:hypothetical protein PG988_013934 [Apiospora saccharicola]
MSPHTQRGVDAQRNVDRIQERCRYTHAHTERGPCCDDLFGFGDDGSLGFDDDDDIVGDDGSLDCDDDDDVVGSGDDGSPDCIFDDAVVVLVLTIPYLAGDDSVDGGLLILTIVMTEVKGAGVRRVTWVDWGGEEVCHGI